MMHRSPRVAFYAPMKPPTHQTPSGDRRIARLTLAALETAGLTPFLASELRVLDMKGDAAAQKTLRTRAEAEINRLTAALSSDPPALWFTYHSYYKAPDLLGPAISRALGIPYAISEPSISRKRRDGPWAGFAKASEAAIDAADRLFWTTRRDLPALEAQGHASKLTHLPAFLDPGPDPRGRSQSGPLRLLAVAMMRRGDKVESYRRIAGALAHLSGDWRLDIIGDGDARADVDALFQPFTDRVQFHGALDVPAEIRARMEAADIFLWPGVNEGVGMVWLEAQAAGLPVVAEDHPAAAELVVNARAAPDDPAGLAALIEATASDLPARASAARAHVLDRHSLTQAATILNSTLRALIA